MKNVINYLLSNDLAEIPKRGRRELKSIIIDDKKFRYNKNKPISSVLTKKLLTVKKTNEYRSYALNKAKDAFSEGRVRQILTNTQSEINLGSEIFNQHLEDTLIQ